MSERKRVKIEYETPSDWEEVVEKIRKMREGNLAPVDTMGCERTMEDGVPDEVRRYQLLVSLMLSSQTKDGVTFGAMDRLKSHGLNVDKISETDESVVADLIKPVGFYKRKASFIKRTTEIIKEKGGIIPRSLEGLLQLPGVGPKMGVIYGNVAWPEVFGIGVDTHVHRISARLCWTKKCKTPEETRKILESWLPRELWKEINVLLVGFGQTICTPIKPKCNTCLLNTICPFFKKIKGK